MERRKKGSGQITYVDEPTRKSKWKATVTDSRGKRKTRYFKTEKEARGFLRDVNSNANKLKAIMDSGVTFSAFAPIFLEAKKKSSMKPTSYQTLQQNVERVEKHLGNTLLRNIDSDLVQQMVFDLAEGRVSKSVMEKSKMVVGAVLKMAAAKHYLDTVPVLDITIPTPERQALEKQAKNNWLKDDELREYEAECRRTYIPKKYTKYAGQELMVHPSGYRLLFLLHTGLRLGEALALTWNDYDEYSKTILIDKNMVHTGEGKITQTPKSEAGERVIILNRQAVADLEMLRKQFDAQTAEIKARRSHALQEAEKTFSGPALKAKKLEIKKEFEAILHEHKYVCGGTTFPYGSGSHGSTLHTHNSVCKAIHLSHKVTVHGLRHTYVTHYYIHHKNDPDFDLATFSKSIGHASVRTTMEIYTHLDMTQNRYVQRGLADLKDF